MYSVAVSLVPRRPSVESEVGRELEAYKLAVVCDGVSYSCAASARGDPLRSSLASQTLTHERGSGELLIVELFYCTGGQGMQ